MYSMARNFEMEEKLISLVRDSPFLYNKKDHGYKNKILKEKRWVDISKTMNWPVEKTKGRWRSLRDRYHRETKKENLPSGSGAAAHNYWNYYEQLKFLSDCIYQRKTETNVTENWEREDLSINEEPNVDEYDWESLIIEDGTRSSTPAQSPSTDMNSSDSSSTEFCTTRKKAGGMQRDVLVKEMTMKFNKFLDTANNKKEEATSIELFFKSIAKEVENANLDFDTWCQLQTDVICLIKNTLRK